jgi:tRNA(Ile2) C34 agmatinyltransferase TiaS
VADLQIIGSGTSFALKRGDQVVAGPYTSHGNATAALRGVEARLQPVTICRCLGCGQQFKSRGRGNRLCSTCRRDA